MRNMMGTHWEQENFFTFSDFLKSKAKNQQFFILEN
jgi:hypothetical protein